MMRNNVILVLWLSVSAQAKEGSLRSLQEGGDHPCAKPEFTMGCDPEVFPANESRARFCDADGSVLLDGMPRSICTGYTTLSQLVLGDDYCGYCVPTSEPSESPTISTATDSPIAPLPSPVAPSSVTPAPVILPAPISPTPVPAAAPSGSSMPSGVPSDTPTVAASATPSGSSMPSGVPSDNPTAAVMASPSGSSMPSDVPSDAPTVITPLPSGSSMPSGVPSDTPTLTTPLPSGSFIPSSHPSDSLSIATATPTAPATTLAAADPPVFNSFSKENPICEVCGAGLVVENMTNEFFLPGNNPPIQCGEFQLLGALGRIPAFLCSPALTTIFMEPNCGCVVAP